MVFTELGVSPLKALEILSEGLKKAERSSEHEVISHVIQLCRAEKEDGGLGLGDSSVLEASQVDEIKFLVEAWLETLNSEQNSKGLQDTVSGAVTARKPMNLTEKILAHHATSAPFPGGVTAGDLITITVDWIIASELSWTVSYTLRLVRQPSNKDFPVGDAKNHQRNRGTLPMAK